MKIEFFGAMGELEVLSLKGSVLSVERLVELVFRIAEVYFWTYLHYVQSLYSSSAVFAPEHHSVNLLDSFLHAEIWALETGGMVFSQ